MAWLDSILIEQLGMTLLHFLWQGLLIGALYGLTVAIVRPASAQARYNLAVGTLLALGLTPVLTFLYLGGTGTPVAADLASERLALTSIVSASANPAGASTLMAWTVAGWMAGVLLLSARLILGWHYIIKLRRSAHRQALAHLTPLLEQLRHSMAIRKSVDLAVSERIRSPVVVGWLKPLILFPPALIGRLSPAQVEMILAHELAHIRRHDHLVNLIQTVIETLLFYHPVVMLISRRIRIERENACDDLAVSATGKRLAYVEMLATLEHLRQPGPRLALGVQDGQIVGRIRRLVERSRPRRQLGITLPALLGLLLAASAVGMQMMPPPEIESTRSESTPPTVERSDQAEASAPPANDSSDLAAIGRFARPDAPLLEDDPQAIPSPSEVRVPQIAAAPRARSLDVSNPPLASPVTDPEPSELDADSTAAMQQVAGNDVDEQPAEPTLIQSDPRVTDSTEDVPGPRADNETVASAPLTGTTPALEVATRPETPPVGEDVEPLPPVTLEPPRLTGGDLLRRIEPDFPRSAQRRGVNGLVEVEFTVDQRGQVQAVKVIKETPRGWDFGESARNAIEQWRFEPYRLGEQPVEQQLRVEFDFDLADACGIRTGSRLPRC